MFSERASVRIRSTTCCQLAARRRYTRSDRYDGQGDVRHRTSPTEGAAPCKQAKESDGYILYHHTSETLIVSG